MNDPQPLRIVNSTPHQLMIRIVGPGVLEVVCHHAPPDERTLLAGPPFPPREAAGPDVPVPDAFRKAFDQQT